MANAKTETQFLMWFLSAIRFLKSCLGDAQLFLGLKLRRDSFKDLYREDTVKSQVCNKPLEATRVINACLINSLTEGDKGVGVGQFEESCKQVFWGELHPLFNQRSQTPSC